ncbi:YdeI family protein, partial [Micromonospora zhanjiangensis]
DGRWAAAYAPPSEAEVPADQLAAIASEPAAQAMFDVLTKTNRFSLIYRLNAVKRAQTRERKIAEFVAMLARHETIYPQKAKPPNPPA